jgi:N-acetylglucosaminyldiphosphoundecaprenol N-acetyl-beta-D-mannosaminyltransferase
MLLTRPQAAARAASPLVLFGLDFDHLSMADAVSRIDAYIQSGAPRIVFTANVAMLMQWRKSSTLRWIYQDTDLLTIDGMALVYASRLLGRPAQGPVSGSALFFEVMSLARAKGYRVFLLGADGESLQAARKRLEQAYHPLRIVGMHDGYFGCDGSAAVADAVRAAQPDILLLGTSSPIKEDFAWTYRDHMNVPVTIGVGGMFDIMAGRYRLAPACVRILCLEWLWRLAQEPRRLCRRYARTNSEFLCLLAGELIGSRVRRPARRLTLRLIRRVTT